MKRLHGVRLAHHKNTQESAVVSMPLPALVRIPMSMHIGAPCTPLVKPREQVLVGQKIGDSDAQMAVPIHSSVSGKVKAISSYRMANGRVCPMVEIEPDGEQTVCPEVCPPIVENRESLWKALRESGLVGLGGAGFPAHVKFRTEKKLDCLLINGAECEPYITSDCRQMVEAPEEVVDGILQVLRWMGIPKAVIGIESNKPEAIRILTKACQTHQEIQVLSLPSSYPQGAEKVLIYHALGRIVEEGQLPADQGVAVMNVSSAGALSRYLATGMPLVERTLTVDGDAVGKPCNVRVPIGTPAEEVLRFAQCDLERAKEVLFGGPMMGASVPDLSAPVVKTTNAILAMEQVAYPEPSACIRCGRCVRACPLRLMPPEIAKAYRRQDPEALKKLKVQLCMNCGCCTYVCPAKRPVAETNQLAKNLMASGKK